MRSPKPGSSHLRVAVTGATGFVGAALLREFSARLWRVTAMVRDPARAQSLPVDDVVTGDLDNQDALKALADGADVFVHLAGVTHARAPDDYHRVNVLGAQHAASAAQAAGARFVHASSLSAREPDLSPYAASKRESEAAVAAVFDRAPERWLALRLPAIYGPGDIVTLPYFKLIRSGFAIEPAAPSPARATLLYVDDAARAIGDAAETPPAGEARVFDVGDDAPDGRSWREIGETLGAAMGKTARPVRAPRAIVGAIHALQRGVARLRGAAPPVREGQANELFHTDWVARENLWNTVCAWEPATPLKEGFAKTVHWYQENGYL